MISSRITRPDEGYAWIVLASSFVYNFIEAGVYESASVYMIDWIIIFDMTKAQVGFVSSLMNGICYFIGIFNGPLVDRFGCRFLAYLGTSILMIGYISCGFVNSNSGLYFTYGVLLGIGDGLMSEAPTLMVLYYFDKKRPLAAGLSRIGSSIGKFLTFPLIRFFLDQYGLQGAMLLHSGIVMQCYVLALFFRPINLEAIDKILPDDIASECTDSHPVLYENTLENVSQFSCTPAYYYKSDGDIVNAKSSIHNVHHVTSRPGTVKCVIEYKSCPDMKKEVYAPDATSNRGPTNRLITYAYDKNTTVVDSSDIQLKEVKQVHTSETPRVLNKSKRKDKIHHKCYRFVTNVWDFKLFTVAVYVQYIVAFALARYGRAVMTQLTPLKSMTHGLTSMEAALLLSIASIASMVSRLLTSIVANLPGVNCTIMVGIGYFMQGFLIVSSCWAWNFVSYAVFMALFGVFLGMQVTVTDVAMADIIGVTRLAQGRSFQSLLCGFTVLTALPLAGWIIDITDNYNLPYYIFGSISCLAGIMILLIPIVKKYTDT